MALCTCSRCGEPIRQSADLVEVRVEYRSAKSLRRLRTWQVRVVCRRCAGDEWEMHDHPGGRHGEQAAMW